MELYCTYHIISQLESNIFFILNILHNFNDYREFHCIYLTVYLTNSYSQLFKTINNEYVCVKSLHIHDDVIRIRKESKIHPKLRENYNMMPLTEMWGTNSDENELTFVHAAFEVPVETVREMSQRQLQM